MILSTFFSSAFTRILEVEIEVYNLQYFFKIACTAGPLIQSQQTHTLNGRAVERRNIKRG